VAVQGSKNRCSSKKVAEALCSSMISHHKANSGRPPEEVTMVRALGGGSQAGVMERHSSMERQPPSQTQASDQQSQSM
jgi:hypothetical protein